MDTWHQDVIERLTRLETKIDNGLTEQVKEIRKEVQKIKENAIKNKRYVITTSISVFATIGMWLTLITKLMGIW